jgi:hypothetical protein
MSVCLSARIIWLQLMDFHEIWYWVLLCILIKKIHILLKLDKNIQHFTWRHKYIYIVGSDIKLFNNAKVNALLHSHGNAFKLLLAMTWRMHCYRQPCCKGYFGLPTVTYISTIHRKHTTVFLWQQWLCKCTTMWCFTYTAYLVTLVQQPMTGLRSEPNYY